MTSRTADAATLERAANETRAALAGSLDELRRSLDPRASGSAALDTFSDAAKAVGADEFMHNLGAQVRDNPLPVTLVGAGLAWLILAPRRAEGRRGEDGVSEHRVSEHRLGDGAGKVSEMGRRLRGAAAAAGEGLSAAAEAVRSTADATRHRVEQGFEAGSEAVQGVREAVGEAASTVSQHMREARGHVGGMTETAMENGEAAVTRGAENLQALGDGVLKFAKENPVLVAVLGAAVGSLIAATLPASSVERDMMRNRRGDAADDDTEKDAPADEAGTAVGDGEHQGAAEYSAAAGTMTGSADAPQPVEPPPPGKTGS